MVFEKIKLEADEKILLIVRRHWFVFSMKVLRIIIGAFLPFILLGIALQFKISSEIIKSTLTDYFDKFIFISALWLLINWMILAYLWTNYYLDLWVVTSKRVIYIDQIAFFVRSVSSFRLEKLQDMNVVIPGFLATMFDYGNIEAQTASESGDEFMVKYLPHPREIKALITEAADQRIKAMGTAFRKGGVENI